MAHTIASFLLHKRAYWGYKIENRKRRIVMSEAPNIKITSGYCCRICDDIEAFAKKKKGTVLIRFKRGEKFARVISADSIADRIIEAYRYAGVLGLREGYKTDEEIAMDRKLILEDLNDRPKYVLKSVESLGLDYSDYERESAIGEEVSV